MGDRLLDRRDYQESVDHLAKEGHGVIGPGDVALALELIRINLIESADRDR